MPIIEPMNILKLAQQTARADRRTYNVQARPLSFSRLWRTAFPNLKNPIFIIGAPRSGTTFLGSCFAEIPEISYHFEPVATKWAASKLYNNEWSTSKTRWFYKQVYAWLMRQHLDTDLRFAEKTPRNCFLIDFLIQAFPKAQFIHIVRDGRDAALSLSKKPWLQAASAQSGKFEPGGYAYGPYARFWVESDRVKEFETTSDIHRCIWAWRQFTESALNQAANLSPETYHELKYEHLVAQPTIEANRMLNFLNITAPDSRQLFQTAVANVRSDSVGQWKKELQESQIAEIQQEAGDLLQQLHYSHG